MTEDRAYAVGMVGLSVFDISNGVLDLVAEVGIPGYPLDLWMTEDLAFVAGTGGLASVTVQKGAEPELLGVLSGFDGTARAVAVVDSVAYVSTYVSPGIYNLEIVDVGEPENLVHVGTLPQPHLVTDIGTGPAGLYFARHPDIQIVDVSNPTLPSVIGSTTLGGDSASVEVGDTYAYLARGGSGLGVVDVSAPTTPQTTSSNSAGGYLHDIASLSSGILGAGYELSQFVISEAGESEFVGSSSLPGPSYAIDAVDYSAVAGGAYGVALLNLPTIDKLAIESIDYQPDQVTDMKRVGSLLFVADNWTGLYVVDPQQLPGSRILGHWYVSGGATTVAVAKEHAYLGREYESVLEIIDLQDVLDPKLAGELETDMPIRRLFVFDNRLVALYRDSGQIDMFDIENPGIPVPVAQATIQNAEYPEEEACLVDAVMHGEYLLVAGEGSVCTVKMGPDLEFGEVECSAVPDAYCISDISAEQGVFVVADPCVGLHFGKIGEGGEIEFLEFVFVEACCDSVQISGNTVFVGGMDAMGIWELTEGVLEPNTWIDFELSQYVTGIIVAERAFISTGNGVLVLKGGDCR